MLKAIKEKMFSKQITLYLLITCCTLNVVSAQWDALLWKDYRGLVDMNFHGNTKLCQSHCFEVNQLFRKCTVATTGVKNLINTPSYYQCYRNRDVNKAKPKYISGSNYRNTYFLNDDCRGRVSHQKSAIQYSNLQEWTKYEIFNLNECRFVCLEIPGCFHQSYEGYKCYVQIHSIKLVQGTSRHGVVYKVKDACKAITCWVHHLKPQQGRGKDELQYTVYSHYECRMKCLERHDCSTYKWSWIGNSCYTYVLSYYYFETFTGARWAHFELKKECLRVK